MSDTKLKPCPFCGNEARILCPRGKLAWIRCDICGIETKVFENKKRAIEFWNRRAEQ